MRRATSAVLVALAAALAAPAAAPAARTQESLVSDDRQFLALGPAAREAALNDALALGADGLRTVVAWRTIAPVRRPRGFAPRDPGAYAAERWDALDDLVRGARARSLSVLLSPSTPAPDWASGCDASVRAARRSVCLPSPEQYRAFVTALGRRFSGTYADENQDRAPLPRVERWSFGNEPNQPAWLYPQLARRRGITYVASAVHYRALVRSGLRALRATGHAADLVLVGETAASGRTSGGLAARPVPPQRFLRDFFCLDAAGRALTGRAAAVRDCAGVRRLSVSGVAHHPYPGGGSRSPLARGDAARDIAVASSGRLTRILDAAAARGRIPRRLPLHYTELGFQSSPPDRRLGVPLAAQASFLNQADWLAWRDPRVRAVAQYLLVDDPGRDTFQSGLRFADGREKPAFAAWRFPLWVARDGDAKLTVYGQLRPLASRAPASIEIQNAPLAFGDFTTVETVAVGSENGSFSVSVDRREGRWRLRWAPAPGFELLSREAVAAA